MRESVTLHISFIRKAVILTASVSLPRAKRKSENGSLGRRGAPKGCYVGIPEASPVEANSPKGEE